MSQKFKPRYRLSHSSTPSKEHNIVADVERHFSNLIDCAQWEAAYQKGVFGSDFEWLASFSEIQADFNDILRPRLEPISSRSLPTPTSDQIFSDDGFETATRLSYDCRDANALVGFRAPVDSLAQLNYPIWISALYHQVLGCGNSRLPQELITIGYTAVTAMDASDTAIAGMVESHPRDGVNYQQGFAEAHDLPGGHFSLVVDKGLMDCILYSKDNASIATAAIGQVKRVLKAGGAYVSISGVPSEERTPFCELVRDALLEDLVCHECELSSSRLAISPSGKIFMTNRVFLYVCFKPSKSHIEWTRLATWKSTLERCREPINTDNGFISLNWTLGTSAMAELARIRIEELIRYNQMKDRVDNDSNLLWTCVDPFNEPISDGRSRSLYTRSAIEWVTAEIANPEDLRDSSALHTQVSLNVVPSKSARGLDLFLDFGVLDALLLLAKSTSMDLARKYSFGVMECLRPMARKDSRSAGQWILISTNPPEKVSEIIGPCSGRIESVLSIRSSERTHVEAYFAYRITTQLGEQTSLHTHPRALIEGQNFEVESFSPPELPHAAKRMSEPVSIPIPLRRSSALLGLRPGPRSLTELLKSGACRRIIVMAGAGISVSSGIPDFRSPTSGLYARLGHFDLPRPEAMFDIKVYTQNIDGLEHGCGLTSEKVVFWHGSFSDCHCIDCNSQHDIRWYRARISNKDSERVTPPRCLNCQGLVKPDVTFFKEKIKDHYRELVLDDFPSCDLLIVMGTSLRVMPFAGLIGSVPRSTPRVLINKEPAGLLADPLNPPTFGNRGFRFHLDDNYRDVAMLGDCDASITRLSEMCGWLEELIELEMKGVEAHIRNPTLLWERVVSHQQREDGILPQELVIDDEVAELTFKPERAPKLTDSLQASQAETPGAPLGPHRASIQLGSFLPVEPSHDQEEDVVYQRSRGSAKEEPTQLNLRIEAYGSPTTSFRHYMRVFAESSHIEQVYKVLMSVQEAAVEEAEVEFLHDELARLTLNIDGKCNIDIFLVRRPMSNISGLDEEVSLDHVWIVEEGTGTLHLPTDGALQEVPMIIITDTGIHSRPPCLMMILGTSDGVLFIGASSTPPRLLPPDGLCLKCPAQDIPKCLENDGTFKAWKVPLGATQFYCQPLVMDDWKILKETLRANRDRLRDTGIRRSDITQYVHKREVQECIVKWKQLLIDKLAYYSGIWLDAEDGTRKLAGMIWFEKFGRVCPKTDTPYQFLDVSYWLAQWAEGKGLVTTAVIVMLDFVKRELCEGDNVTELLIYCRNDNIRSQGVAHRLGLLPTVNATADNCFTLQLDDMWKYRVFQAIRTAVVHGTIVKEEKAYESAVIQREKYAGKKLLKLRNIFDRGEMEGCSSCDEVGSKLKRIRSRSERKWKMLEECYELEKMERSYAQEASWRKTVLEGRKRLSKSLTERIIPATMEIDRATSLHDDLAVLVNLRKRRTDMERNQWQMMTMSADPAIRCLTLRESGQRIIGRPPDACDSLSSDICIKISSDPQPDHNRVDAKGGMTHEKKDKDQETSSDDVKKDTLTRLRFSSVGSLPPLQSIGDVWRALQGSWQNSLNHKIVVESKSVYVNGLLSAEEIQEKSINDRQCITWMRWQVEPDQSNDYRITWTAIDKFSAISSIVVWRRM
ncbi:NAD-dependent protein deacetylase sirtuin-2 [Perkinsus chesapeaki]|uniref:NAD-dependent protein deacetylase sirtuin-2 n=1 Tax=Perkinsus chesapeaki TaxID=330153 RepID=A0A7J6N2I9_PERCH|nr:NAD-dependent protein deacetylase sirtuin-2 [Perkinsus chesapeaki]